ncbi:TPA: sn-glycerol-3-phosphate ABC transporter ATP-binding protein UgpC [Clostridium perfringens]|uniref:ABC transporter ATP-binding protein n=1 Tax=Clostridium perfringens TaxID=1502 RepID=UPI001A282CE7|nr:sn-glycerol-3-phosphate ABC transporter ATP-binding protein UgpC [Clostridium perfringens]ELC8401892.1 sn-glycerol-3-phosphate ABC transporter ATP-binding protein UgpC [Clostridium perfringens]MDH5096154.1 sn-glycerol-3-phosphate import ATP-binding protein UgpC [Clostridium perfringens]MDM0955485.1 sn-glycerol-3-phosphate ABC transporter ATP-binding protein UgpC [Clostridium perfringens]HAT4122122.1 sn-glycerol-3-phosphate ABC transporter ATP-binding protein UgpC [Clostridium perfringens]HB
MGFIEFNNVEKQYKNATKKSVTDFNLSIDEKEFIVFVGPSGCGKSTTLRMLAGFEEITGGTISIDGNIVNNTPPRERGISMVFQNYALYPHMTVEDNIAFGLKNIKTPKDEIKKKVNWAIEILGLEEYRKRKPKNLSGGQRQRVALGRAIVRNQKVFLMDEPLSNLDAKLRVSMRNEISKLHRELGSTTIYVTHDQVEAMTMADRIVVMKDGIIQQIGTPMDLYDNPRNKFVGSFIGSPQMNFLNVEVKGNKAILENGSKITLPEGILKRMNNRQGKLCMGFRAEDIKLDNLNIGLFEDSIITSSIENTEIMGNENNLYFKIGNTTAVARVGKEDVKEIGEQFKFVINVNKVHFFDLDTEENILNLGNTLTLDHN